MSVLTLQLYLRIACLISTFTPFLGHALLSVSWIAFSVQSRGRGACEEGERGPTCKLPKLFILWSGTHPRGGVLSSLWLNQARPCLLPLSLSVSLSNFRQSRFPAASLSRARARGELARLVLHPEVSSAEEDHQDPDQFTGVPQSVRLRPRLAFALNHVHPRQRARENKRQAMSTLPSLERVTAAATSSRCPRDVWKSSRIIAAGLRIPSSLSDRPRFTFWFPRIITARDSAFARARCHASTFAKVTGAGVAGLWIS